MEPTPENQVAPATKKCPFCAEEILAEAKKCRFCGEFMDGRSPEKHFDKNKTRQVLAIVGSLLLVLAPFAPLVSAPIFGRITLFQQGKGDGVILLITAFVALGLSIFGRYGLLWISGLIGLIDIVSLFHFFWFRLPDLISNYRRETAGNVFGSIGDVAISNIDPDWGAAVLLLGTIVSLGVAVSLGFRKPNLSSLGKVTLVIALVILGVWGVYRVLLVFFPYLRAWPSLFGP